MDNGRRMIVGAAGVGLLGAVAWRFWPVSEIVFETVRSPAGFRRIAGAGMSPFDAILSIGQENGGAKLEGDALCKVAFGGRAQVPGRLVIASFSDFFCPYCRVLEAELYQIAARDDRVVIVPHEVPLLGFASLMAAKGAIAAGRQGAYDAYYARLIRTSFVPNAAYMEDFARNEGLDVAQFKADLESKDTTRQLERSLAAFRSFGFVGTPGIVVGRTLVNGVIAPDVLRRLVDIELESGASDACG